MKIKIITTILYVTAGLTGILLVYLILKKLGRPAGN